MPFNKINYGLWKSLKNFYCDDYKKNRDFNIEWSALCETIISLTEFLEFDGMIEEETED